MQKFRLLFILSLVVTISTAQKFDSTQYDLDALIISADRFSEKKKDIPRQVEIINRKKIQFLNKQSTADLLQETGQVAVQKSQQGGGSPILRGFEANKILLVLDGIRMNNAIYRGGHLQNIIRIDQNNLEAVEVLFGPSSLMYGSDALGGVVNFVSIKPQINTGLKGYYNARYSGVNQEISNSVGLSFSHKKIALLASYSLSDFGDLMQGKQRNAAMGNLGLRNVYQARLNNQDVALNNSDPSKQIGSAYQQENALFKLLYQAKVYQQHLVSFHNSKSTNVPRYDRLSEMNGSNPKFAEWYYGPEKFYLGSYQFEDTKQRKLTDQIRLIGAFQQIEESRISRNFNKPIRTSRIENVKVYSLNLDMKKRIRLHELRYGAEWTYNQVNSKANAFDIDKNIKTAASARYPDGGSQMSTLGAYLSVNQEIDKWIISEGIRVNQTSLQSKFTDKQFYSFLPDAISQKNLSVVANIGIIRMLSEKSRVYLNVGNAYRTPNVDDIGKTFDSKSGEAVILPNGKIGSEKTLNTELGINIAVGEKIYIQSNIYYTHIWDALVIKQASINGIDSVGYDGKLTAIQMYVNAQTGKVMGYHLGFTYKPIKELSIEWYLNYTYGRVQMNGEMPLDHIPPMFGRTAINYQYKRLKVTASSLYNGAKKLSDYSISGEDNLQYATSTGMPTWYTLNVIAAYTFTKSENVLVQTGIENILDRNYRAFASGISAPGRNIWVSLKVNF
ncbi:MAG: TonB-dependent receptor [bacterium]|nr:TonB-dependent receptor [bacterium]